MKSIDYKKIGASFELVPLSKPEFDPVKVMEKVTMKHKIMKHLGRPFEWMCVGTLYMVAGGLFIGSIGFITLGIKIAWFGATF